MAGAAGDNAHAEASPVVVNGPIWRGRNAVVYRVEAAILPGPAALKFCRHWATGEPDPTAARRQFDALTTVDAALGRAGPYRVPSPFLLFETEACYLAEWIDGPTVADSLVSAGTSEASRMKLVGDAGKWLRRFHDSNPLQPIRLDTARQMSDLDDKLASSALTRDPLSAEVLQLLRQTEECISQQQIPCSWAHGDFKCANLLLSANDLFGIDVSINHTDVVAFDLAQFLNDLAMMADTWRARWIGDHLTRLEDEFLLAYGAPLDQVATVVAWVRAVLLLSTWSDLSTGIGGVIRQIPRRKAHRSTLERLRQQLVMLA